MIFPTKSPPNFYMAWKEYRKGRAKPWLVRWGDNKKGENASFKTEKQADLYIERQFSSEKEIPRGFIVTPEERSAILRMRKLGSILKLVRFLEDNYKVLRSDISLKEARELFIAQRKKKNLRNASVLMYEKAFKQTEGIIDDKFVGEFMSKDVEAVMSAEFKNKKDKYVPYSAATNDKILLTYNTLFNWLVREGIAPANPFKNYRGNERIVDKKEIRILTPDQTREFLHCLPGNLKPAFAIMAFAGVRPSELHNNLDKDILKWDDVDFQNKRIDVRTAVAKTRKRRIIIGLPPNIWEWLDPWRGSSGPIIPISSGRVDKNRQKACKRANITWSSDILRHGFASYGYYKLGAELTVDIMGHTRGFDVFVNHYKGLSNRDEAEKYFSITP